LWIWPQRFGKVDPMNTAFTNEAHDIKRLASAFATAHAALALGTGGPESAASMKAALHTAIEALALDAVRYRWLRDRTHRGWERFAFPEVWFIPKVAHHLQTLDAAIDAARQPQTASVVGGGEQSNGHDDAPAK
jgi:hypothetical protein